MSAKTETPQRAELVAFGMWLFLASEAMFFTAFFAMTIIMRVAHPELLAPRPLGLGLALVNTAVMALSVWTMVGAVKKARLGESAVAARNLSWTAVLGLLFLGVKAAEYAGEIHGGKLPSTNLFFGCYYTLTGFEGLHVLIGVGVLAVLAWRAKRGDFHPNFHSPVDVMGLYWGLLALVWVFILAIFYIF
ncbi:MAG TPA: cytochrome c oxidase subunit 3 [bacterium]|nr:cytochrome c oxidase subunit 3 [bacterium]